MSFVCDLPTVAEISRRSILEGFSLLPIANCVGSNQADPWFAEMETNLKLLRDKAKSITEELEEAEADFNRMYPASVKIIYGMTDDDRRAARNINELRGRGFEALVKPKEKRQQEVFEEIYDLIDEVADQPAHRLDDLKAKALFGVSGDDSDRDIIGRALLKDLCALSGKSLI